MSNTKPLTDPVAEAGRRIVAIVAALNRTDQKIAEAGAQADWRLSTAQQELYDLLGAAEETATAFRAATPAGAMVQILLASSDLDTIVNMVPDEHHRERDRYQRRVKRCLFSVLHLLAQQTSVDVAEMGGDYYGAPLDPHEMVAQAMAA